LLREQVIEPKIIEYLQTPPTAADLRRLLKMLKLQPDDLLRKSESEYHSKVAGKSLSDAQLIAVMVDNPILIERPIFVMGNRAIVGRPPENVLQLIK
jgi:arsenate reductase